MQQCSPHPAPGTSRPKTQRSETVVRRFASDRDVVRVRLAQSRHRYANELGIRTQRVNRAAADIAHAAPQSADHLREHVTYWSLVGNAPFDPFRNELAWR